jgi:Arc/MetJ-type ribon-helix-helix transcriptional regulator
VEFHGQISIPVGLVEAILAAWLNTVAQTLGRSYTAGMAITISPELEGRIQRVVASGRYATAEDAVEAAVQQLEFDDPLAGWSKSDLQAWIDEGLWSAENEPLLTPDEVRTPLACIKVERDLYKEVGND